MVIIRMTLKDVHELRTEKAAINFLRTVGFYGEAVLECTTCTSALVETSKKDHEEEYLVLRCQKGACQKTTRVRHLDPFFGVSKCRLSLTSILELTALFVHSTMDNREVEHITGRCRNVTQTWWMRFRKVCAQTVRELPKMRSSKDRPIQIDESSFSGSRKYNKGRLLGRNKAKNGERAAREELVRELALELESDIDLFGPDIDLTTVEMTQNKSRKRASYGNHVVGPWVLGLYYDKHNVRYFVVPDRSANTLTAIIQEHVEAGSSIHTDQWGGYCRLNSAGYIHNVVNHSQNYVDPVSGVHTQGIERAWVEEKLWLRKSRRPRTTLQLSLDEATWRRLRTQPPRTHDLVYAFLNDLRDCISSGHIRDIME